jgi:hypothetical protein
VLSQALSAAGKSDTAAGVIWATASSYAPHAPLAREAIVWAEILAPIGDQAERTAVAAWSGLSSKGVYEIPTPTIPPVSSVANKLDTARLQAFLEAAAGPTPTAPDGVTPNRSPIQVGYEATSTPAWAKLFGATAANGIGLTVDAALQSTVENIAITPVAGALEQYAEQIAGVLSIALAPLQMLELRSRALLWRSALYSSSQRKPYRDLDPQLAVLAIAADLAADLPPLCPASVDNLVWEAAHAVLGTGTTSISAFATALTGSDREAAAALLGTETVAAGRKPLASFLRAVSADGKMGRDVRAELGVEADMEIKMADLARWLFRDLRAERIVAAPARSRRRSGK